MRQQLLPLVAALCLASISCTGRVSSDPSVATSETIQSDSVPSTAPPAPLGKIALPNGNTVAFYRVAGRISVSEEGAAYTSPSVTPALVRGKSLPDLWRTLSDAPIPQALADAQKEVLDSPTPPADYARTDQPPTFASGGTPIDVTKVGGIEEGFLASPQGCNNGCCDYEWMTSTFEECQYNSYWDYQWLLFNYGWSYVNRGDIASVFTYVCAAEQSTFGIDVSGTGGTWTILAAHYMTWYWLECTWPWCGGDLTSHVNTSTDMHLHTYCGLLKDD